MVKPAAVGRAVALSDSIDPVAESPPSTVRFDATRQTTAGRLVGCGVEFSQVTRDHIYENGLPVVLRGSIDLFFDEGRDGILLKLNGDRFDNSTKKLKTFAIRYAYLTASGRSLAQKERGTFQCKDGGFCAVYTIDEAAGILRSLLKRELQISFNREEGSLDVTFLIDPAQAIDAQQNVKMAEDCVTELINGRLK